MNMPSHHQSAFFDACYTRMGRGFRVAYYSSVDEGRKKLGWEAAPVLKEYERDISGIQTAEEVMESIDEWQTFLHIVPGFDGPIMQNVIINLSSQNVPWMLWNETPGIRLIEKLRFNNFLYNIFYLPVYKKSKKNFIEYLNRYGFGSFMQGKMAREGFGKLGVDPNKMRDLYYAPAALKYQQNIKHIDDFIKDNKVFLCTAQLTKRKGIDILLKAFAKLNPAGWRLILVGKDSSNDMYKTLSEKLKIEKKVLFTGSIPFEKMGDYMNYADVFVLPTRFDGWGAVLNEAASLSKALISTNMCGAAWHMIQDGVNGYRIKPNSIKDLQKAMSRYILNSELVSVHGYQSKKIFDQFTPEESVNRMLKAITSLSN